MLLIIGTSKKLAVYNCWGGHSRIAVTGITESSVNVKQGFIFVVRRGKNDDGASYIAEAIERGAVAIVIDRPLLSRHVDSHSNNHCPRL